jgi:hypothetical protein
MEHCTNDFKRSKFEIQQYQHIVNFIQIQSKIVLSSHIINDSYETMYFKVRTSKEDTIVDKGAADKNDIEKRYKHD